jgi:arsenate reductase (thioredoxin)
MPDVLFLCTGNSCRSQMAEGWLQHLAGDRFHAFSAGLQPSVVHPLAIEAMREVGIDISGQQSKDVAGYLGHHFAYIITVCDRAQQNCPIFPGPSIRKHWPIEDPATAEGTQDERMVGFRKVRDDIEARVRRFLAISPINPRIMSAE